MIIDSPIIIIGTGRCGSTLLYKMFANHPDVAFISNWNNKFPKYKILWRINTIFRKFALRKGFLRPSEAYFILNKAFKGYNRPIRTLKEFDVGRNTKERFRKIVGNALKFGKKKRFLYKCTGWSRIRFFNEIFPDALFINVIRDGRAVAHSLLQVKWWDGWKGVENWRWGRLPKNYDVEWNTYDKSFAVLAGIEWKLLLDEMEESRKFVSDNRFLQVKYEDLVKDPLKTINIILRFCGLEFHNRFRKRILKYRLQNLNYKWKDNLPETEQEKLNKCLSDHLTKYNYEN